MIPKQEVYQKPKSQFDQTFEEQVKQKKQRIWPGRLPQGAKNNLEDDDDDDDIFQTEKPKQVAIDVIKNEEDEEQDARERIMKRRQVIQSAIVEEPSEEFEVKREVEVVDDEVLLRRRRAIRRDDDGDEDNQSIEKKKKKDKKRRKEKVKKEDIVEEEEQYYEEEQPNMIELLKPVFVSREEREKLDKTYEEEIRMKEEKGRNLERKKLETKLLIINSVRADAELTKNDDDQDSDGNQVLPNDDDNETLDGHEYGLWKIRELKRLKYYREEKTKHEREKAEILRRRNLTDQQRIEEDFKLGSDKTKMEEKTKYVFMQKYYNKGAFYQDSEDPIFQRDYNLPVGEDLWVNYSQDKSKLPKILQLRRGQFGKRGMSKYTHLTDQVIITTHYSAFTQDTTDFNPENAIDESIRQKFFMKQAGNRSANRFDQFYGKK